jgi:hypothetical protein
MFPFFVSLFLPMNRLMTHYINHGRMTKLHWVSGQSIFAFASSSKEVFTNADLKASDKLQEPAKKFQDLVKALPKDK